MQIKHAIIGTVLLGAVICLAAGAQGDPGFIRITPEEVQFNAASMSRPSQAILFGDPSKPGIYVVRVRFPPGTHSDPHFHSQDRHVTVIKGIWWMGVGEQLDFRKAVPMKAGSYAFHPARAIHWDGAGEEEAIVQIVGMGPVETVQVGAGSPPGYWPTPKPAG
jgi:quercetin dioxygenase-like cupin family protein